VNGGIEIFKHSKIIGKYSVPPEVSMPPLQMAAPSSSRHDTHKGLSSRPSETSGGIEMFNRQLFIEDLQQTTSGFDAFVADGCCLIQAA
jgi:hypothetical protein